MLNPLLLAHTAATLYMTGVIWMVQLVHYPLFAEVGPERFADYERLHQLRISAVVMPPMLIELVTAYLLATAWPGPGRWAAWTGLGLLAVIWLSTFLLQVPRHEALAAGFDEATIRSLVLTNWLRTLAWTARAGLVLWLCSLRLRPE